MTNLSLAQSYLLKAAARLKTLDVLRAESAFSDVVREAQEIVELCLKAMLRQVGVEPPKWHDVGDALIEAAARFPETVRALLPQLARDSAWLRKEREFAFYGDIDFIPTERYTVEDADRAMGAASRSLAAARQVIPYPHRD